MRRRTSLSLNEMILRQNAEQIEPTQRPIEFRPICYYCKLSGMFTRVNAGAVGEGRTVAVQEEDHGKEIIVTYGICSAHWLSSSQKKAID
jgi:hypothetical protein